MKSIAPNLFRYLLKLIFRRTLGTPQDNFLDGLKSWALLIPFVLVVAFPAIGAESKSKLVDVDKNSKLSDYFKKINKKVTDDSESKELVTVKKLETTKSKALAEEDILLKEATTKSIHSQF